MGQVFGEQARPRVLLYGLGDLADELAALCGTAQTIDHHSEVEQTEWDAVVTFQAPSNFRKHLFILTFGVGFLGRAHEPTDVLGEGPGLIRRLETVAREMVIGDDLPAPIMALVASDLIPKARAENSNTCITFRTSGAPDRRAPSTLRPFLLTRTQEALAGSFLRAGGEAEVWSLPYFADAASWLKVALSEWGLLAPNSFPQRSSWTTRPDWQTQEEVAAAAAVADVASRRDEALANFEKEETKAREALEDAAQRASGGLRRLLTDQGESLVDAVVEALETLGFHVRKMDELWKDGEKREDLRLTVEEDPDWEAIVEVSGLSGGGKGKDLMGLVRFFTLYERDEKEPASAAWYIVNHFRKQDPSERTEGALPSNPEELSYLVEVANGLVLTGVDLFRLVRRVEGAELQAEGVRATLRSTTGQYRDA